MFSASAISASDVNVTDSYATGLVDDTSDLSVPMEKTTDSSEISVSSDSNVDNDSSKVSLSSEEVLGSENSNNLSTNINSTDGNNGVISQSVPSSIEAYGAADKVSSTVNIADTIESSDLTKYYKGSAKYTATFMDNQGKVLANANVKFEIVGVTYNVKTNAKGVASLAINLKPGTYTIVAVNPTTGASASNKIKVLTTINANDVSKVYTDAKKFTATFLKSNGKALANKYIKFKLNGKTYKVKTNSNGVASLSMTNLKTGTYKIISYNNDGLTRTNTVKVVRSTTSSLTASTYTFLKSESKTIKATLLNGLGYAPGAGKIVKVTVNGKTYSALTNSKGVASLKLPSLAAGTYTVKYSFAGNSFYKASSTSEKLYILPSKTSKFTLTSGNTFGIGSGNKFSLKLLAGTVPLVSKTVKFTINGKNYTRTTNSNGATSLSLASFKEGKYPITFTFDGDSKANAKTGSTTITIKERTTPTLTWKSGSSFYSGMQSFKVLLQDANKKAVSGKTVSLTINGITYTAETSLTGIATFTANVGAGIYNVSYNYDGAGDNDNGPANASTKINVVRSKISNGYGYWVFGGDMKSVDLSELASKGTTDIFLNFYAVEAHGKSAVESWIASAGKVGIRVHIWMQSFYDGGWINPIKNGAVNTAYFNQKIAEAKTYANLKGIAGVHLDYLRYPGTAYLNPAGTAAISQFAKQVAEAVHAINKNIIVSCAMMPETTLNAYYYGQDISALSSCLDVIIPMAYKGNYGHSSPWLTSTAKWFIQNSEGAEVWMGLQGYRSDSDVSKLSVSEITKDCQAAIAGGATGTIIFRWSLTNHVNFNTLSSSSTSEASTDVTTTGSVPLSDILTAANSLKSTISSKGTIPATVSMSGVTYSTAQFLYLMAKAIVNINSGSSAEILPVVATGPASSAGSASGQLAKEDYVDAATRVANYIANNEQVPNYATSPLGNIKYDELVDAFSRVLAYYKSNSALPNYVEIKEITSYSSSSSSSSSSSTSSSSSSSSSTTPSSSSATTKTVSIKDILTGATTLKTYYSSNSKLPSSVTAGGIKFTMPEFLYLMSQAIYQIGNSNSTAVSYISGVSAPESPYGDTISSQQLTKDNYITVANNVAKFIVSYKQAPNYASSTLGKIIYEELVDSFSRVLAYYNTEGALPNYVVVTYGSGSSSTASATGTGLTQKNTASDTSAYLKSTTNCPVGNSAIKSVVNSLTSGLTSDLEKAKAIYNYVRDKVSYSFYYDTKYGAAGTLSAKTGNCVDQSHLLISMYRTAGLAARYVHGTCTFSDGTFGHVWAQVLVGDTWYVVDPTSTRNSFGNIVNWNTNTFSLKGIYAGISF
ncbi:pseudomurein-binding repeat-containing protein [Methanobrevibacter sp.]